MQTFAFKSSTANEARNTPGDGRIASSDSRLVTTSAALTRLSLLAADLFSGLSVLICSYLLAGPGTISAAKLLLFFMVTMVAIAGGGMYNKIVVHPATEMKRIFVIIGSITFLLLIATLSVNFSTVSGYRQLAMTGLAFAFLAPTSRAILRLSLARSAWWGESCAVVTKDKEIFETLKRVPELGLKPVALYTDESVLNDAGDSRTQITQNGKIGYLMLSRPDLDIDELNRLRRRASKVFRKVILVPNPASQSQWTSQTVHDALLVYGVRRTETWIVGPALKRIFDFVVAGICLVLVLPFMAIIGLLIRLDSSGACIFKQERLGLYGKTFNVFKFRTMACDAEDRLNELLETDPALRTEYETFHKLRYDPRITRIGRLLRRFSLDELPQLLNVLIGNMSLIGPRAYMPRERPDMLNLDEEILLAKPGISGLWQVSGRNQLSFKERVWTDVTYNRNFSVWMDLFLMFKTIPVVLSGDGAN